MFRRVSANVLLKSVIAVVGAVLVAVLANGAWDAWRAYGTATRLETVADVASSAFRALHNLRLDRSFTLRGLTFDGIAPAGQLKQAEEARAGEFPALASTVANLRLIDMPERDALVDRLDKLTQTLTALAKDSAVDWSKPKAERRPGLDKQYEATVNDLLTLLDNINERLVAQAKYSDPFVDQMLAMRDAVWLVRYNGGDGSVTVSNGIVANKKMSVEQLQRYANIVGRTQAGWDMVEKLRVGSVLPPALVTAIDRAKASYFAPEFVAKANEILAALAAGSPSPMPVNDWTNQSVPRLASMTTLAETALDAGKQHAAGLVSSARWNLIAKLAMLIGAAAFVGIGFMLVSRRVMGPLAVLQTAMMKVANGDLAVEELHAVTAGR